MRSFDLAGLASTFGGEYVLGTKDLNTDACYMIYGLLKGGEAERLIRPGKGREEILCALDGPLLMHTGGGETILEQGNAIHVYYSFGPQKWILRATVTKDGTWKLKE